MSSVGAKEGEREPLEHVEEALRGARERVDQFDPDTEKAEYDAVKGDYNILTRDEDDEDRENIFRKQIRETDYSYPQTKQIFDDCDTPNRECGRALSFLYHSNVIGRRKDGVGPTRWDLRKVEEDKEKFEEMFDAVVDDQNKEYIFQEG